jgi:hypothetical protein
MEMALILGFDRVPPPRPALHGAVTAKYSILTDEHGRRCLQFDTYGSNNRQTSHKSQTFRIDLKAARDLKRILEDTFGV